MSRVDFYILNNGHSVEQFACSISSKALKTGKHIHINTQNDKATSIMDDLLWTFRDISFLPHEIFQTDATTTASITLGHDKYYPESAEVIINLADNIPDNIEHFNRIVEIVGGSEERKMQARQRYREYRKQNYEIHDHQIDKAD